MNLDFTLRLAKSLYELMLTDVVVGRLLPEIAPGLMNASSGDTCVNMDEFLQQLQTKAISFSRKTVWRFFQLLSRMCVGQPTLGRRGYQTRLTINPAGSLAIAFAVGFRDMEGAG